MALAQSSTPDLLGHHFCQLPRELRDLIYPYIVTEDTPIHLEQIALGHCITHPIVSAELLEAKYTNNTLIVTFSDPTYIRYGTAPSTIWGPYPQYKQHIRRLVVAATETILLETELLQLERECTVTWPEVREEWLELLNLPRLEHLIINMQKQSSIQFFWANFSPILYQLRTNLPKLSITFNVSFDELLESAWYDGRWTMCDGSTPIEYEQMGFVDVTELIERPSEEDRAHVEQYLTKKMETRGRNAIDGLLVETHANRRILGPHYVVKEPNLLRVLTEEHYEIYKKAREERSGGKEIGR